MCKIGLAILMMFFIEINFKETKAQAETQEFSVYQVFRGVDLGESDRPPPKDIFVNMGSSNGVKKGSILDVYRRVSSFDNLTQKLAGDHMIPVARIKVIHSDEKTAVARLDKFVSLDQEPGLVPQAIMIGDLVRPGSKKEE